MSTNYYLRVLPPIDIKKRVKAAVDTDNFEKLETLSAYYRQFPEYPDEEDYTQKRFGLLHLGKRSGGWKFLWNPHLTAFCTDYKTGKYELQSLYSLSPEGIESFLKSFPDAYIVTEYDKSAQPAVLDVPDNEAELVKDDRYMDLYEDMDQFTIDAFLEMAFSWNKDHTSDTEYTDERSGLYDPTPYFMRQPIYPLLMKEYPDAVVTHGDIWVNGLRFAQTNSFS